MSSKTEKDKAKQLQDKCQSALIDLLRDEDNKYCVDCDSKGPRWASWNLGVFLCIRCAGIHRNLGVHISKVKSVNLDTWTPEQVVSLQQMGNSRARAVYEANLPDNFRRPQNDSSLETFIRAKYEHKKYIAREWVPPTMPKVNWEKEIDEEIERQRRKKKTIVEKKSLGSVEVPQLPKPKNPSPKPGRAQAPPVAETKQQHSTDLLGLQNGEDVFSNFLSAPTTTKEDDKKEDMKLDTSIKSEEESFFNQTAPAEKEKIKLTKDSILALYGNTPVVVSNNSFNTSYPSNFGVAYPMQQQQQNFQNFGVFPQQNYNGMQQQFQQYSAGISCPAAQYQGSSQQQAIPPIQFQAQPTFQQFQSLPNQFTSIGQFQQQQQQQNLNFVTQGPTPNPFFGSQTNNLQQQFGSLNLGAQATTNPAPTLATNIWQ